MNDGRHWAGWGAAGALAAVALAGCALGPQMKEPLASYDLGPPRSPIAGEPVIKATLMLPDVTAAPWLDGTGIVYRLSYDNSSRPQAYANSRWVAPPAALLTQRLRSRFAGAAGGILTSADGARADYALRVELEDFSQSFAAPGASRVSLRARASLVKPADRKLVAQRVFSVERAAPTADARGSVAALGQAGDELIEQLIHWVSEWLGTAQAR